MSFRNSHATATCCSRNCCCVQELEARNHRLQARCDELAAAVANYGDSDAQLQDQIISLTDQRKSMHSEVVRLSGEVGRPAGCTALCPAGQAAGWLPLGRTGLRAGNGDGRRCAGLPCVPA